MYIVYIPQIIEILHFEQRFKIDSVKSLNTEEYQFILNVTFSPNNKGPVGCIVVIV